LTWGWLLWERSLGPPVLVIAVAVLVFEALALAGGGAATGVCTGVAAGLTARRLAASRLGGRERAP